MIVLDTHVLVWWVTGDLKPLSKKAREIIGDHKTKEGSVLVSSISVLEIAMLVNKGRIKLAMDLTAWLKEVEKIKTLAFVPVDNTLAIESTQLLEPFHKDPADRIIVALARHLALPLITADEKILAYRHVKTIW